MWLAELHTKDSAVRSSYLLFSQWLVKRSVETREEMWQFVRSFAVGQFNKLCPLPEEQRTLVQQDSMLRNIRAIKVMFSLLSDETLMK